MRNALPQDITEIARDLGVNPMALHNALAKRKRSAPLPPVRPEQPVAGELWTTRDIAGWVKVSADYVRRTLVNEPGFPAPRRLNGSTGMRRWVATDVLRWIAKRPQIR